MRFKQSFLPAAGLMVAASLLSGNALAATNCSISYYCYQTMTPDKEAQARQVALNRRILARSSQPVQRQNNPQPTAARVARQQPNQAQTQQQQQQLARQRAEQQRQQQLARQRAEQQRQQQLARQRAAQAANPSAGTVTPAQRQVAAERERQRQEQQRRQQQRAAAAANTRPATNPVERTIPTRFTPDNIERTTESCDVLKRKIQELNRQAVLESQSQSRDAAVRLFRVVAQLTSEGKKQNCPGM